jgi:hypothetical protein
MQMLEEYRLKIETHRRLRGSGVPNFSNNTEAEGNLHVDDSFDGDREDSNHGLGE